jgi:PIN domain nuclease of toxin-antitoxin system
MTATSEVYVTDTHALVWRYRDDPRLSPAVHAIFDAADANQARVLIPTVVLTELLTLKERRMPALPLDEMLAAFSRSNGFTIVPFDIDEFYAMKDLPKELEIHDRMIAATARVYGAKLISRDRQLGSLVETVW